MRKGISRPRGRDSCRHLRGSPHRPHLGARAQCLHHLHPGFEKEDLCQQARSRHRAFGLQDRGYADGVFIDAAVNPSRFYSKQLLRRVSSQYDIENESLEERIMAVLDYISGMTDIYALDIYQKINGISLPIV